MPFRDLPTASLNMTAFSAKHFFIILTYDALVGNLGELTAGQH